MKCGLGLCGHCQWGPFFVCKDGPVFRYDAVMDWFERREVLTNGLEKKAPAFGLEIRLLRRLPAVAPGLSKQGCWPSPARWIGLFSVEASRAMGKGSPDLTLVDGSITTAHDAELIQKVRRDSKYLVALGTCACSGGIQALRNFKDVNDFIKAVYAHPEYIQTLEQSTPLSAHIKVDYQINGCPINKRQLLEVMGVSFQAGCTPPVQNHSVCLQCKARGNMSVILMGTPCLGPVTHGGCGALCPTYHRGCYGCYGPKETPNTSCLAAWFSQRFGIPKPVWCRPSVNSTPTPRSSAQRAQTHEKSKSQSRYPNQGGGRRWALPPGKRRRRG